MSVLPRPWTAEEFADAAATSSSQFRAERLLSSDAWGRQYAQARAKFEKLFGMLGGISSSNVNPSMLANAYTDGLGEAVRYLAGPPISDDDLRVLADVESITPGVLASDADSLRKVVEVISAVIDRHRFPWIAQGKLPTDTQREAALLASSVLLAAQRIATERRNDGKNDQETKVKNYLTSLGFTGVPPVTITTIVKGPGPMQFCAECQLGERKADVVVRLHDTRLLAIECKVSNSATNSVKRLNNDAAVKAEYWLKQFGTAQVVPAAVLAGVYKVLNLEQAQTRGLAVFWSHDLDPLGAFIERTK